MTLGWNGETALTSSIPVCYVVAVGIFLLRRKPEDTSKTIIRPSLRKSVLGLTCFTILVSLAQVAAQAIFIGGFSKQVNDRLYSDSFFVLIWIILFLGLIDFSPSPSYPHFATWILAVSIRTNELVHEIGDKYESSRSGRATLALTTVQIVVIVLTLVVGLLSRCFPKKQAEKGDEEETQPLLGSEQETTESKKDSKKKEDDEAEQERKAIRARPYKQYLWSFRIFLPYMFPSNLRQRLATICMFICSGATRVVNLVRPLVIGEVINKFSQNHIPWDYVLLYVLLYFLGSGVGIPLVEDYLKIIVTTEQRLALKRASYNHIMNLSADFHDSKKSSRIWQSMEQARSVVSLFHSVAFDVAPSAIDLFASLIVLWAVFGPYVGLLVATTIILFIWITAKALSPRAEIQRDYRDAYIDEWHQLIESSSNWYTSSQFNQIPHEKEQYRQKGQKSLVLFIGMIRFQYVNRIAKYAVLLLAFLGACALAAVEIGRGEQQVGAFVTMTTYWAQMQGPLNQIVNEVNQVVEKFVDAEKLMVLLERVPSIQDDEDAKPYDFQGGAVDFENVHFSYDGKRKATEATTFHSAPGTTTALVGETGGGKSTLLKLLFRFYDPEKGRVLIDGQDIRHMQLDSLRQHIGMVPQDPDVFNATVYDNVRYPDLVATDEQVQEACKAASLHDKIMTFPKGYDEKVGERGSRLSGGELQRLAIARAIIKKPDILLLDEATSSVDSVTEASIQASLNRLCSGKTSFVIAHRLSTILKADQILVIEAGKVVESGSHSELLKQKGAYHKLWTSQLKLQDEQEKEAEAKEKEGKKKEELTLMDDLQDGEGGSQQLRKEVTVDQPTSSSDQQEDKVKNKDEPDSKAETQHKEPRPSIDGRGRTSVKDMVSSIHRNLSPGPPSPEANHGAPSSPTRSKLKANAAAFVPQAKQTGSTDGTVDSHPAVPEGRSDGTVRPRAQSEPGGGSNETEESNSTSSNEQTDPATKYSRIPKRNH